MSLSLRLLKHTIGGETKGDKQEEEREGNKQKMEENKPSGKRRVKYEILKKIPLGLKASWICGRAPSGEK